MKRAPSQSLLRSFHERLKFYLQGNQVAAFRAAQRDLGNYKHKLVLLERVDEARYLGIFAAHRGVNADPLHVGKVALFVAARLFLGEAETLGRGDARFLDQLLQVLGNLRELAG